MGAIRTPWCLFAGEMGVARAESGAHSTISPCVTGGDIDAHHVTAGSRLYLPVEVEGALFSMRGCILILTLQESS